MPNYRKPTTLKIQQGTFRKDRMNSKEPIIMPLKNLPEAPKGFTKELTQIWNKYAIELIQLQVIGEADLAALADLTIFTHTKDELYKQAMSEGITVKTNFGGVKSNPTWKAYLEAWDRLNKIRQEFGLTPASRTRVNTVNSPEKKDNLQELLNGKS